MSKPANKSQPPKPALASRVEELRAIARQVPAEVLDKHTGANYQGQSGRGAFHFSMFGVPTVVTYPDLIAFNAANNELPLHLQGILVYYFQTSDGSPLTGEWVSFADLPNGRMYNQAFQGYSGNELVKIFGLDVDAFKSACERGGGVAAPYGDAAYIFYALPRLPLLVNYWCGDEDFPSSCKVLFDKAVSHYLPTDVCAILGSILTGKIAKNAAE